MCVLFSALRLWSWNISAVWSRVLFPENVLKKPIKAWYFHKKWDFYSTTQKKMAPCSETCEGRDWGACGSVGRVLKWGLLVSQSHCQQSHCVVSLSQTVYPLLITGSTQVIIPTGWKIVDWDVKHQNKNKQIKDKIHCASGSVVECLPADKKVQLEINFLISQLKQMLWAHNRIVLMRILWAPIHGQEK